MVESIGLPFAYYQFPIDPDNPAPPPPFVCFFYPRSNNVRADNTTYLRVDALTVELYCDEKRFDLEAAIEAILDEHELPWVKTETWLDSENMLMTIYETEVHIDGE